MPITVTVSSKHQIVVPKEAREKLHIRPGHELLVLCKDDRIVLIPRPEDFAAKMAGLHKDVWDGVNVDDYVTGERDSWERQCPLSLRSQRIYRRHPRRAARRKHAGQQADDNSDCLR